MATHSSLLAWKIPWTVASDRLQSIGSQRVGHHAWEMPEMQITRTDPRQTKSETFG